MSRLPLICFVVLVVCGCQFEDSFKPGYGIVIPDSSQATAAKWIKETVAAANPHSDEEPEHNIAQAELTATRIFGKRQIGIWQDYSLFIPYAELSPNLKRKVAEWAGFYDNNCPNTEKILNYLDSCMIAGSTWSECCAMADSLTFLVKQND